MVRRWFVWFIPFIMLLAGCTMPSVQTLTQPIPADTSQVDTTPDGDATRNSVAGQRADLLSAFFGLDDDLPGTANLRICGDIGKTDGMPVIFSHEVDSETLQAADFRVVTASGQEGRVDCVTLAPALDIGERRTVLLLGDFGSADTDPPATVEIVGNLLSLDGALNFRGAVIAVTQLAPGPALVLAESVPVEQWKLEQPGGPWSVGSGCPDGTVQAIRAVWQGGIIKPNGEEVDDVERMQYTATLIQDGSPVDTVPFALGDLDDGDNNHLLCLSEEGTPQSISFSAGYVVDPNGDLNPATQVEVRPLP